MSKSFKNKLQRRLINLLVRNLFNTIDVDDIVRVEKDGTFLRGRKLDRATTEALSEDARKFKESTLLKLINNDVKYLCNIRMYEKGRTDDDILAGKLGLWVLETINKSISRLSKL